MMKICPACKKKYGANETPHKLLAYDMEPQWNTTNRFYICEVTAVALTTALQDYATKTDPADWVIPGSG